MIRDPAQYQGQRLCPRCADGYPCCADVKPDGSRWTHDETCRRYWYGALCGTCEDAIFATPKLG